MRRILLAIMTAAAVPLQGCEDSTGSSPATAGSLAFRYSGARSGGYSAKGPFGPGTDRLVPTRPFAAGVRLSDPVAGPLIGIIAYAPVSATLGHQVTLLLPPVAPGQTLALATRCAITPFCPLGLVSFDLDLNAAQVISDEFAFTSGWLTVTSLLGGRIAGTFSGTAEDGAEMQTITVTGGSFDVPLVTGRESVSGDRAWMPASPRLQERPRP